MEDPCHGENTGSKTASSMTYVLHMRFVTSSVCIPLVQVVRRYVPPAVGSVAAANSKLDSPLAEGLETASSGAACKAGF